MKISKFSLLLTFLCLNVALQAQEPTSVKIGTQEWTTKNLEVVTFRNGDRISEAKTNEEWQAAGEKGQPAWCYYDNDPKNGEKYGKLYNWYAIKDPRGIAPKGYHVPSKEEWDILESYLGGEEIAGKKLKSTEGWLEVGNGTNESGFSGLPGGFRYYYGYFYTVGNNAGWWSSTELDTYYACKLELNDNNDDVSRDATKGGFGFYVRCLRD